MNIYDIVAVKAIVLKMLDFVSYIYLRYTGKKLSNDAYFFKHP